MKSRLLPHPVPDSQADPRADPSLDVAEKAPVALVSPQRRRTIDRLVDGLPSNDPWDVLSSLVESASPCHASVAVAPPGPTNSPAVQTPKTPVASPRPQGRLLIAVFLVTVLTGLGFSLIPLLHRAVARGFVTGHVHRIASPWEGEITAISVRVGDHVAAGDALVHIQDPELTDDLARIADQLTTTEAKLRAAESTSDEARRQVAANRQATEASYHDLLGELAEEEARLADLSGKLARRQALAQRQMVAQEELESIRLAQQGLEKKIAHLRQAASATLDRWEKAKRTYRDATQLGPLRAEIAQLHGETARLQGRLRRGQLRSPVDGTIVSVLGRPGERTQPGVHIVEVLAEDSVQLKVFVDVKEIKRLGVGQRVNARIAHLEEHVACAVDQIGRRLEPLPQALQNRDRPADLWLPIYLKPCDRRTLRRTSLLGAAVEVIGWDEVESVGAAP